MHFSSHLSPVFVFLLCARFHAQTFWRTQCGFRNAVPLKREGSDFTRVTVAFLEDRYLNNGTQEKVRIIDRIFIRDGKIFRIHQWDAKME